MINLLQAAAISAWRFKYYYLVFAEWLKMICLSVNAKRLCCAKYTILTNRFS